MQELIRLETNDWELTVSGQNIASKQKTYFEMLDQRNDHHVLNDMRFQPPLQIQRVKPNGIVSLLDGGRLSGEPLKKLVLTQPLFFENTQYQFEWLFNSDKVNSALIAHPLQNIEQSFRFAPHRKGMPARLIGNINTRNDIGWLNLPLLYEVEGKLYRVNIELEVLPTKMQLHTDLPAMYKRIDNDFPLWRFSLAEKTEQDAARSVHRGNFPLLWLAQFKSLREQFENALKIVAHSPHSRLQKRISHIKVDRLKGRLNHKLAEQVREDINSQRLDKRYQQNKKYLSVDTPENRFIKMVVKCSKSQLKQLTQKLIKSNYKNDRQRLSDGFLKELTDWQAPLLKMEQSFLKEVGEYSGLQRESLVLQQKTGYSAVYRVWQEFKYYLDVFAKHSTISMKSVAETYEVWCFLTVRQILTEKLHFKEVASNKTKLTLNDYFEFQLKDGLSGAGAFSFERDDGLRARLAHEPIFRRDGKEIRSFWVTQKPDILLEVTFPDNKKCIWLFDAKYRIKTVNDRYDSDDIERQDFVPDDAINQMHRYRDALIHIEQDEDDPQLKSRPVFGAFALYPGFFDQITEENPYTDSIKQIGIGAFAMLPSAKAGSHHFWLESFLTEQIGLPTTEYPVSNSHESLYINEAARIPYYGMKQVLHDDLVFITQLGGNRSYEYVEQFKDGGANWYHIPKSVFNETFNHHIAKEICYLAIVNTSSLNPEIDKVYRVINVKSTLRSKISKEQAGVEKNLLVDDDYWLFELGEALTLSQNITGASMSGFRGTLKLSTLSSIYQTRNFDSLESVYRSFVDV